MTHEKINTQIGSRADDGESECTVIPGWTRHQLIVAAWVVGGCIAIVAYSVGYFVARS